MYIVIDCGTSFLKAALIDEKTGEIVRNEIVETSKYTFADSFPKITGTVKAVKEIMDGFLMEDIGFTVAIATEMHGFLLADKDGKPLCDYVSWKDEWAEWQNGDATYLEELKKIVPEEEVKHTGMALKSGIASTNLYVLLDKEKTLVERKDIYFYTLGDYLIRVLTGKQPFIHPTNAAASGLYDLKTRMWSEKLIDVLGFERIHFPKIAEKEIVTAEYNGKEVSFCEAIGDQQAALLGSGLNAEKMLSFNMGTGSQVSVLNRKLVLADEFQTRPFFDGFYLNTIPHVPCGRALHVIFAFFEQFLESYSGKKVDEERLWKFLWDQEAQAEQTDLEIDMSFFVNSVTSDTRGSITNIGEKNFYAADVMHAAVERMAQNYYKVTKILLQKEEKVEKIVFSGGVAEKNEILREKIASCFLGSSVQVAKNETFVGLWRYINKSLERG